MYVFRQYDETCKHTIADYQLSIFALALGLSLWRGHHDYVTVGLNIRMTEATA